MNKHQKSNIVNELASKMSHFTDNIIVSLFLGPAQVTAFYISQRLPQIFQLFSLGIGNSTWAALGHTFHNKEYDLFRDRVYQLTKIICVISLTGLTIIAFFQPVFIRLWIGDKFYLGEGFTIVVCMGLFIQSILSFWGWLFLSTGEPESLTKIVLPQSIINLGISIFFTIKLGPIGPVLGSLTVYIVFGLLSFSINLKNKYSFSFWNLNRIWIKSIVLASAYYYLLKYISLRYSWEITSWPGLVLHIGLTTLPLLIISLFMLCNSQDRNHFFNILLKRLKK
jgi:O-antigen/teichoic acid export membrane protein